MSPIINVILNSFQDLIHKETRCRNKFGMTTEKGFTLIELMVVLSVTAVLGTLGIAGFVIYNQIQVLQSATSDVVTVLNLAKSRAQSQIKPSGYCTASSDDSLSGYNVVISAPSRYALKLRCSETGEAGETVIVGQDKSLPASLSFRNSTSFFFPVLTGGVQNPSSITVDGYGRYKTITVNSFGGVSIE